jgi:hypothetical protein
VFNPKTGFLEKIETRTKTQSLQNLGYTYDSLGNVHKRTAEIRGLQLTESFTYDTLNRLTRSTTTSLPTGSRVLSYQYDNGRPHALSAIVLNGLTTSFAYDAAGNMTSHGSRTLSYNSGNQPTLIKEGGRELRFKYGPDGSRFYQEKIVNNQLVEKIYYLAGGAYEEIVDIAHATVKRKSYVNGLMLHVR